jgi:hypothetical protein
MQYIIQSIRDALIWACTRRNVNANANANGNANVDVHVKQQLRVYNFLPGVA